MSQVTGRATGMLLAMAERHGLRVADLVRGLPLSEAQLRDRRTRVDFAIWALIVERLQHMLGGEAALSEFGTSAAVVPFPHEFKRVARLLASPEQLYRLNSRWAASAEFRGLRSMCESLPDGRLRVTMSMPAEDVGSRANFVLAGGILRGLPGLLDLPPSEIEADIGSHHAIFLIRPPRASTLWKRARHALGALAGAKSALETLGDQQQEIVEQNRTLAAREAELRHSEERWRALATSVPALMFVVAADGHIEMQNREGELPAEVLAAARHGLREVEVVVSERWLSARIAPVARGWVVLLTDVTERRHSEDRLARAQKLEALGRFAGGIAHDFNNLLTIILSCSELMMSEGHADQDLHEIRDAASRGAELTRQLLALSRQELRNPRVVDVNSVVRDTDRMLRRVLGEDVVVSSRLDAALWRTSLDPGQLHQVMLNLALNARDAMPAGGRLFLETANVRLDGSHESLELPAGDYTMLAMSDTGSGMTAETQAHLFEPFYTTKGAGKGTGLGLSIVRGIVEQNGGGILVYSEAGVGTTFRMYFPRCEAELSTMLPLVETRVERGGDETVLLVEDDGAVRRVARGILAGRGYRVLEAASPGEARRLEDSHRGDIALLVTDVIMPEESGLELSRELSRRRPGLRTLFMSGYAEQVVVSRGVVAPGVKLLQKPFSSAQLARKVREALDES